MTHKGQDGAMCKIAAHWMLSLFQFPVNHKDIKAVSEILSPADPCHESH